MIHLIAGESARGTLATTSIPGEKLSIDDILMEGPIVDSLRSESAWELRADHLEAYFAIPKSGYLRGKDERYRILRESLTHDEIVLWFEFDLFCQANLMYYLTWYEQQDLRRTRLTLICPETIPGRSCFRGLGELPADELELLFPQRQQVTTDQLRLAGVAWNAYASDDPRSIEDFLAKDSSALPLLSPALRAHLERFPAVANGLGVIERVTLEILTAGPRPFHELFPKVTARPELFRYGMGDLQLQSLIDAWTKGPVPLVNEDAVVEITPAGRDVIENRADAIEMNGIDVWYGGVHLTPSNPWRWDPKQQRIGRFSR